ncbi:nucleoside/nucleotide kinase family protein [Agromyces arachidis]|uniref:nucleoside/nucleotide kinase family protein n=1 Tax=Agromyces arachidis TaxID=766966 RepID=UPI00405632DD
MNASTTPDAPDPPDGPSRPEGPGGSAGRPSEAADAAVIADLAAHLDALADARGRVMVGICGPPGVGKSTLARRVQAAVTGAVVLPMDGFHLASDVIAGTDLARRRGAPDTFDVDGFVVMLERLRRQADRTVFAPDYRRGLEDPVAAAIPIEPSHRAILVEGNYLLSDRPGWRSVADLLDEVW